VLHQLDRVRPVLGALDEADAGQVRVRARPVLVGPGGRDRERRVVLEDAPEVVVVGEADVAAAGVDRLQHVDVGAEDLRLVGHPAAQQLLGGGAPALGDHVGHQRLVVLVVGCPQAELPLELRLAQVLVVLDGVRGHALGRAHRRADAQAHAPPLAVGVAELGRHLALERLRAHGCQQARLLGAPEVGQVRGHQQVGRRVRALGLQPLEQLGRRAAAQLERLAGLLLEVLERLLVSVLRAAVVDHDVGRAAEGQHRRGGHQREDDDGEDRDEAPAPAQQCSEHRRR
jgi:hypothetical protein